MTQRPPALSVEDIVDRAVMRQSAVLSRGIEYLYDLHARTVNRQVALHRAVEPFSPEKCSPRFTFDAHEIKALRTLPAVVKDIRDLKREFIRR